MVKRLTRWFIFSVLIALLPIWLILYQSLPATGSFGWLIAISAQGELLLITALLSGASLGTLIGSGLDNLYAKLVAGGGCVIVLVLSSLGFAYISSGATDVLLLDSQAIATASLAMLAFGIVASGSCIALARGS